MIEDMTGKFDALSSGYADRYLQSLAGTVNGVAIIDSYEWKMEEGVDVLTWYGHVEAPGVIHHLHFEILNDPADGEWEQV